jgi:hypothetical protein
VGQEDLRDLSAEGVAGELLEPGAHALEVGQVARAQRSHLLPVATLGGPRVDAGEHPVAVLDGEGRDLVAPFAQEALEAELHLRRGAGVQVRVAVVNQRKLPLLQQRPGHHLAADDVVLIFGQRHLR